LCEAGLTHNCDRRKLDRYRSALDHELTIIEQQGLANYFLIVWDWVHFARLRGTRSVCQGRGSAANSLVAYLLDITPIDPLSIGLVFERFLSAERATAPDIDLDFAADRREEAIQYLYQKYGHDNAAMACTVVTFGARQTIRDVGMALGFPNEMIDRVSDSLDIQAAADLTVSSGLRATFGPPVDSPRWQQWLKYATAIQGLPRHLGIHNGGMILAGPPLNAQIPIEPATMADRFVIQWDKDSLELAGWIKLDVLGLRMLSAIADACDVIEQQTGKRPNLSALRFDDRKVYDMICRNETVGVFQVESRAQQDLIPRFQPRTFADLTVEIALIRPGPIQANMVHPYLRRRDRRETVTYLHPALKPALQETLGVILFQEQVLKVARDLAGFTPGEGELLRRALSHKHADQQIELFRAKFIDGAQSKGVGRKIAEQVFNQLKAFGGYSFQRHTRGLCRDHVLVGLVAVLSSDGLFRGAAAPSTDGLLPETCRDQRCAKGGREISADRSAPLAGRCHDRRGRYPPGIGGCARLRPRTGRNLDRRTAARAVSILRRSGQADRLRSATR
jgi:error-prone DNA polymerase